MESNNTARSFEDKWTRNQTLAFEQTLNEDSEIFRWILNRNGFENSSELSDFLAGRKRVLDAGCGNGRVTALLASHAPQAEVIGIDLTAADVAAENLVQYETVTVSKADLLDDLTSLGQFDFIYCQEVLHHTFDPRAAFSNLVGCLTENGEIAIYVYKQKAPLREFADDHVRKAIAHLSYDDAMEECRRITNLGKVLSELDCEIAVPTIESLGIEEGSYTVQRFLYHFFLKCFWSPELDPEGNAVINYDWYHPQLCSRHTLPEVRTWFTDLGLKIEHEHVDPYGITMRGRKQT